MVHGQRAGGDEEQPVNPGEGTRLAQQAGDLDEEINDLRFQRAEACRRFRSSAFFGLFFVKSRYHVSIIPKCMICSIGNEQNVRDAIYTRCLSLKRAHWSSRPQICAAPLLHRGFGAGDERQPLSPALSPLLRRGEREKMALRRSRAEAADRGPICGTALYIRAELELCAPRFLLHKWLPAGHSPPNLRKQAELFRGAPGSAGILAGAIEGWRSRRQARQVSPALLGALLAGLFALTPQSQAQDAIRMSLASEEAARARHDAAATLGYYNLKLGPTGLRFGTSLGVEYNDNVVLNQTRPDGDFIFRPQFNTQLLWPITDKNSLNLSCP